MLNMFFVLGERCNIRFHWWRVQQQNVIKLIVSCNPL